MNESTTTADAVRDVKVDRVFDAPRAAVYAAWADPDQLSKWYGPEGFAAPRDKIEVDLRVGGVYNITMVVASEQIAAGMGVEMGTEYPDFSEVVEVVEGELILLRSQAQVELGLGETTTRIEFADEADGKTRVTITSGPFSVDMAPKAEGGWGSSFNKLDAVLAG